MPGWLTPTVCAGCGTEDVGRLCDDCLPESVARPPVPTEAVRGCFALSGFDSPLASALKRAKYGRHRDLMVVIAEAWADRIAPALLDAPMDAIVPVPSPWTRRLIRGFAPSAVLAQALSRRLDIPVQHALCIGRGPMLAGLGGSQRQAALAGRVRSRLPVSGHVLLVDDVVTTGATAEACCRELLGDTTEAIWLATVCASRPAPPVA